MNDLNSNNTPVSPFLKWAGGKRWFARKYLEVFPAHYKCYYEPFLGSGAVFFALNPSQAVLTDINHELINAYCVVKNNWTELIKYLHIHNFGHSREHYYLTRDYSKEENSIKRAANFLYLNRTCWNGLYRVNLKGQFNVPIGTKTKVLLPNDNFEACSIALNSAKLAVCDFEQIIDKAAEDDLLFVDPPYTVKHNNNCFIKYNEKLFAWSDQIRLRDSLLKAKLRGVKIVATNAAHESIKELYQDFFEVEEVWRQSVIAGNNSFRKQCSELLIRGNT